MTIFTEMRAKKRKGGANLSPTPLGIGLLGFGGSAIFFESLNIKSQDKESWDIFLALLHTDVRRDELGVFNLTIFIPLIGQISSVYDVHYSITEKRSALVSRKRNFYIYIRK